MLKKFAFMALWVPSAAFAEVGDKVPSLSQVWMGYAAAGMLAALLSFAAARSSKIFGLVLAAVFLCFFALAPSLYLFFDDVGRALYLEEGIARFIPPYLAALLIVIGVAMGIKKAQSKG